ncbi:hypothetical protein JYU04_02270 [Dehalococcoides mccartyi]|nr:hypothetical protein [Dehalococcoides mccartyi]
MELKVKKPWLSLLLVSLFIVLGAAECTKEEYKRYDIANSLLEPVYVSVNLVNLNESLPVDISKYINGEQGKLRVVGYVYETEIVIPTEYRPGLLDNKLLVSAWSEEGRVMFQQFIKWDQLFIGSDQIFTLVMTPQ